MNPERTDKPVAPVTVIIINWNGGPLLARCLSCLYQQTVLPQRILVIDNDSFDDSLELAAGHADVEIWRLESNSGFAAANNLAIRNCDTEFIALLNPDAFPQANWLEELLKAAQAHPDVAAFGSLQLSADHEGRLDGIGDVYHISGRARREGFGCPVSALPIAEREIFSPCAAAALYRRAEFIAAGGFDEDYFCLMEDVDLGFRLRLAGHRALFVPDAIVSHKGAAATGRHTEFAIYHGHRNLVWTFVKNMPAPLFWLLLPLHLLLNLGSIAWFAFHGQGGTILRAKRDALRGLPLVWRKRRAVQAGRKASCGELWRTLDKGFLSVLPGCPDCLLRD